MSTFDSATLHLIQQLKKDKKWKKIQWKQVVEAYLKEHNMQSEQDYLKKHKMQSELNTKEFQTALKTWYRKNKRPKPATKEELQTWLQEYCQGVKNHGEPNTWDVTNVTDMSELFAGLDTFNAPIDQWDTSQVTTMAYMFSDAIAFNQPLTFDTSKVTVMCGMFRGATAFNQPLPFNTEQVTNMYGMFVNATAFNQPLTFDTRKVTTMYSMFQGARAFNQPLTFDTKQVTTMYSMFSRATAFNQPLAFDTSKVTDMSGMFREAIAFDQPLTFDTSQVTDMAYMFEGADAMTYPKPGKTKASGCSAKDGPLPSISPPTILTAVKDDVYRYEWPALWPDFRCVITEDINDEDGGVDGYLREYKKFHNNTDGNGMTERKVIVKSTPLEVSIELVYLGEESGICTLAVASVLYAVLDRINKKGHFPTRGKVYIESRNGCRAFNCYNRAFQINGFSLRDGEYESFQEHDENHDEPYFKHTLHYYSERQTNLKAIDRAKKKLNKVLEKTKVEAEKAKAEYHQYVNKVEQNDSSSEENDQVYNRFYRW